MKVEKWYPLTLKGKVGKKCYGLILNGKEMFWDDLESTYGVNRDRFRRHCRYMKHLTIEEVFNEMIKNPKITPRDRSVEKSHDAWELERNRAARLMKVPFKQQENKS